MKASWKLILRTIVLVGLTVPLIILIIFLPAGTWDYWQAWVYLTLLFVPMTFALIYLLRYSPDLLERRFRFREKETTQKRVIGFSWIPILLMFIIPGIDQRFGWSNAPVWIVIVADVLFLIGYSIELLVFRENRYASRIVEVMEEQKVISTGPYAIIRHPMYAGTILMYIFSPLALGSYWAMIPGAMIILILVPRILNEEKVLKRDLKGYVEYAEMVKWRIIPGVW